VVATAERASGARQELRFRSRSLPGQSNHQGRNRRDRHRNTNDPVVHCNVLLESGMRHSLPIAQNPAHRV